MSDTGSSKLYDNPIELTEDQKRGDEYLHREIDFTINICSQSSKDDIAKAYTLRNGERPKEKFAYLWEAFGIQAPAQLRHVPVLKSMFDALVGQERLQPLNYAITSKNPEILKTISKKRRNKILKEISFRLQRNMEEQAQHKERTASMENMQSQPQDHLSDPEINKIEAEFKQWRSDLEIKSQDMMEWLIQSMNLKFYFGTFMDDLIPAGQCYYQVKPVQIGRRPYFRVVNPLNVYFPKDNNIRFVKDHERAMIKEEMSVTTIFNLYGHKMKETDKKKFLEKYSEYVSSGMEVVNWKKFDSKTGKNNSPGGMKIPTCDVHYCEWKANNKIEYEEGELMVDGKTNEAIIKKKKKYKYRLDRFEGVRIMEDIYVDCGQSKYVQRPIDDPSYCWLSINGLAYNDRNGNPYSLVLKTEDIADKIDILYYHAEALVAMSGTKALLVNFPDIPVWLEPGTDPMKRAMKFIGLMKQGLAVVDTSQSEEGAGKFQHMSDVDLSLTNSVMTLFQMISQLEETAAKITGVPRQAIGQLSERDGKGVTEIAMNRSTIVTQPLFSILNEVQRECLTDLLNAANICYPDGIQGSYKGESGESKIFSIEPGEMLADADVHVSDSGEEIRNIEKLQGFASELAINQLLDVENVIDMFTMKSLTRLKQSIVDSANNKKQDNTAALEEKVKQYEQELNKLAQQVQNSGQGNDGIKQQELQLKAQDMQMKHSLKEKELNQKKDFDDKTIALNEKRVELEAMQLVYSENAKEVKDK
jgi:hypothetical protein